MPDAVYDPKPSVVKVGCAAPYRVKMGNSVKIVRQQRFVFDF
jgi:hypothetical protein